MKEGQVAEILRRWLAVLALASASSVALAATWFLAQAGTVLGDAHQESVSTLTEVRRTVTVLREAAEEQRGYYRDSASALKATSKAAFIATRNLARYIEKLDSATGTILSNTDGRMEDIAKATVQTLERSHGAAAAVEKQVGATGYQAEQLLADARGAVRNLEALAARPELAANLQNMEKATAHTAKTAENLEQATASIRDMLSPRKKGFWRRLLELLIPRPAVNLGR